MMDNYRFHKIITTTADNRQQGNNPSSAPECLLDAF
jgi:hypothetical protein